MATDRLRDRTVDDTVAPPDAARRRRAHDEERGMAMLVRTKAEIPDAAYRKMVLTLMDKQA